MHMHMYLYSLSPSPLPQVKLASFFQAPGPSFPNPTQAPPEGSTGSTPPQPHTPLQDKPEELKELQKPQPSIASFFQAPQPCHGNGKWEDWEGWEDRGGWEAWQERRRMGRRPGTALSRRPS